MGLFGKIGSFLTGGGGDLVGGLANTITGAVQNKKALEWQKKALALQMDYGREMWEKQNEAENDRMALQNQWNKEAAAQSQEYAKEMFDYTGYENQVKQMKAAGLNPALMNGGSGSGGQAAGATVEPAQAFQPMGIQVALQAQQAMAQTNLTNAQAQQVRAQTTRQNVENLVGSSIDLIQKLKGLKKSDKEISHIETTIGNLRKTSEEIDARVSNLKEQGLTIKENRKLIEFQNDVNQILKNSTFKDEKGHQWDYGESVIYRYYGQLGRDAETWSKEEKQALFDKEILDRLTKDLDAIAKGKLDELTTSSANLDLMVKKYEREGFELQQDKAFSELIGELGGNEKYGRLLMKLIEYIFK